MAAEAALSRAGCQAKPRPCGSQWDFCHWLPQTLTAPGQSWRPGHLWESLADRPGLHKVADSCIMKVNRKTQATRCVAVVNVDKISDIDTAKLFYLTFQQVLKKTTNKQKKPHKTKQITGEANVLQMMLEYDKVSRYTACSIVKLYKKNTPQW